VSGPVLILGAASDIARATARAFAAQGHPIQLAARRVTRLDADKADLEILYGVPVTLHELDATALETHAAFVDGSPDLPQVAVCAVGMLGNQAESAADPIRAAEVMRSNFEGPASLLGVLANAMESRGSGTLVGISSVAGLRGRASNYVYGSAKAGFSAYLSGLRNRLAGRGVHVVSVLPGFVATAMTEGMELNPRLTAAPEEVAQAVVGAVKKNRNIVYIRPIWRLIMAIIQALPEPIFKKTSL